MSARVRAAIHLAGAAVLGAVVGAAGAFVQAASIGGLPLGLVLALAAGLATVVGAGVRCASRLGAAAAFAAWSGAVLLLSFPRPEGDLVLTGAWHSYVYVYGGAVCLAACLALDYGGLAERAAGRLPPRRHPVARSLPEPP